MGGRIIRMEAEIYGIKTLNLAMLHVELYIRIPSTGRQEANRRIPFVRKSSFFASEYLLA